HRQAHQAILIRLTTMYLSLDIDTLVSNPHWLTGNGVYTSDERALRALYSHSKHPTLFALSIVTTGTKP
ncbi:hypothetical protein, partial [Moorena sp. SIO4A5]|uniref:hypothetical protein n=1 Tax=Moorena sp. SIO4A5 TaxID=2607838 RepID=UPI0025DB8C64